MVKVRNSILLANPSFVFSCSVMFTPFGHHCVSWYHKKKMNRCRHEIALFPSEFLMIYCDFGNIANVNNPNKKINLGLSKKIWGVWILPPFSFYCTLMCA